MFFIIKLQVERVATKKRPGALEQGDFYPKSFSNLKKKKFDTHPKKEFFQTKKKKFSTQRKNLSYSPQKANFIYKFYLTKETIFQNKNFLCLLGTT